MAHQTKNLLENETSFTPHKQYLFGLLIFRNLKKTHAEQSILQCLYSLSEKKELTSFQKRQQQKTFSPVCMLSVELALMNVFTPCDNWKTLFFTKIVALMFF